MIIKRIIFLIFCILLIIMSCRRKEIDKSELYYYEYKNLVKEYIYTSCDNFLQYMIEEYKLINSSKLREMRKELRIWLDLKVDKLLSDNIKKIQLNHNIKFEFYLYLNYSGRYEFFEISRLQDDWIKMIETKIIEYFAISLKYIDTSKVDYKNGMLLKDLLEQAVRRLDNNPGFSYEIE